MSREVVTSLYGHNSLISLVRLDRQRKPLMHTDVTRREIWEWRDHTPDYQWTFGQKSEVENINANILTREDSKKFFKARIVFPDLRSLNKVRVVRLNTCEPDRKAIENND